VMSSIGPVATFAPPEGLVVISTKRTSFSAHHHAAKCPA
jgi:hypothetical protein